MFIDTQKLKEVAESAAQEGEEYLPEVTPEAMLALIDQYHAIERERDTLASHLRNARSIGRKPNITLVDLVSHLEGAPTGKVDALSEARALEYFADYCDEQSEKAIGFVADTLAWVATQAREQALSRRYNATI